MSVIKLRSDTAMWTSAAPRSFHATKYFARLCVNTYSLMETSSMLAFTLGMSVICKILTESRPCYAQYAQLCTHTVCETVRPRIHTAFSKQQPNKKFVTGKCVLKVILISGMYTCMYIGASLPSMYENDEFHLSYVSYHIHAFLLIRVKDILHGNR